MNSAATTTIQCGAKVELWRFNHQEDEEVLSAWSTHFRNHYCLDTELDEFRKGIGCSRADYLRDFKFPDNKIPPGPSIRAGDFGEILVADYLEYLLQYWVPRTRYNEKVIRNESTKGADTIGFRVVDPAKISADDTLAIFEVKTQFSGKKLLPRLQDAIDGSAKDQIRKAESLNSIKQRLRNTGRVDAASTVERFQNPVDRPYKEHLGAALIVEKDLFDEDVIKTSTAAAHPNAAMLSLIVISGDQMMKLVHRLYERAMNEA